MKKAIFAWSIVFCALFASITEVSATTVPTQEQACASILAMREEYPEGARWTNADQYGWKGGGYEMARGCMAFAHMMSDAVFGDLPARKVYDITIDDVRVGDVLRNGWDSHSVIVIEVNEDEVVVAEGNWSGCVHWGRRWSAEEVAASAYLLTRYSEDDGQISDGSRERVVSRLLDRNGSMGLDVQEDGEAACVSKIYQHSQISAVNMEY